MIITDACATGELTGDVALPSINAHNTPADIGLDPFSYHFNLDTLVATPSKCIPELYIKQYTDDSMTEQLATID